MDARKPQPKIIKSEGTTPTERLLARLCEQTFLKLWSYPNPFKDDKKELCDLLAVFENHVFIFFDRDNQQINKPDIDPLVRWKRWKKDVIDSQIRTAHGAERYLRSGRKTFLDSELKVEFPLPLDLERINFHKIVVAHGAKDACKSASEENVYGSLAISYSDSPSDSCVPFQVQLEKSNSVHVLDSHNLEIVLTELNTIYDLVAYFDEKRSAIGKVSQLSYCGEEDLLAHYFLNFDKKRNRHFIGPDDGENYDFVMIGEGEWRDFVSSDFYARKKEADEISAVWDHLVQKTCQNFLNRTSGGNSDPLRGKSAVHEMAKEPRLSRRALSEFMISAIRNFPESLGPVATNLSLMPSYYKGTGYVFLQLRVSEHLYSEYGEYREKRHWMLEIACGAAKNKFPDLTKIVGIAMEPPKFSRKISEDFILLECDKWPADQKAYYENANLELKFFNSDKQTRHVRKIREFP